MTGAFPFLISGILFGLVAGISPGPLLTLVITQTLKHNRAEGIKTAIVPFITDIPIVLVSIFILIKLTDFKTILGSLSICGALFICYLAFESLKARGVTLDMDKAKARSLQKGIITNFLSPHPYLFWITVGSPIVIKAYNINPLAAVLYIAGFYICLVGSKIIVAIVVDKSKTFLNSRAYVYVIRFLGLALIVFAVIFVRDGLRLFGVL
jgi:threonine/homoserine/homoserine lactone efflux protein